MSDNTYTGKARLRARDIREALKNKVDPAVLTTLETLAEQDGTARHQIEMLADLVNKFTDQVMMLSEVLGTVTGRLDLIQGRIDASREVKDVALNRIKNIDPDEL